LTEQQQTNSQTSQVIQRLETQVGQLAKELSEGKRGEFPAQTIPNPRGHEQLKAITILKSGKTIDNKVGIKLDETVPESPTEATTSKDYEKVVLTEEGTGEQIEVTQDPHWEKSKEVSTEASSASTIIPELPRGHENSLLVLLDEQTEVIKVEKLSKYSSHSIPVHDSLPYAKLFENSQSDLPQSMNIRNYLSVGRIHSLWSKRRKDWCFKFKLKSYYQKHSSSPGAQAHLPRLVVLMPLHALKIHILQRIMVLFFNYCSFYFLFFFFSFPWFCFSSFVFQEKCVCIQVWGYATSHT
jgi:hypothetical protein